MILNNHSENEKDEENTMDILRLVADDEEYRSVEYSTHEYSNADSTFYYTDDQKQAINELTNMKIDLGYTDEYDVTERVKQLNEELANDNIDFIDIERKKSIKFNDLLDFAPDSPQIRARNRITFQNSIISNNLETENLHQNEGDENSSLIEDQLKNGEPEDSVKKTEQYNVLIDCNETSISCTINDETDTLVTMQIPVIENDYERIHDALISSSEDNFNYSDDEFDPIKADEDEGTERIYQPLDMNNIDKSNYAIDNKDDNHESKGNIEKIVYNKNSSDLLSHGDRANDEKVLIERNGTFELVSRNAINSDGVLLFDDSSNNIPDSEVDNVFEIIEPAVVIKSNDETNNENKILNESVVSDNNIPFIKTNSKSRPFTAKEHDRMRQISSNQTYSRTRAVSANPSKSSYHHVYKSPYAMSPDEKEKAVRDFKERQEQIKKEEEDKKMEQMEQVRRASECFQGWLNQKKDLLIETKKQFETNSDKSSPDSSCSNSTLESIDGWYKRKMKQKRQEKKLEKEKLNEEEREKNVLCRTQEENSKAFKDWMKKKNMEINRAREKSIRENRLQHLLNRRTRKANQMREALSYAYSTQYIDYYTYKH